MLDDFGSIPGAVVDDVLIGVIGSVASSLCGERRWKDVQHPTSCCCLVLLLNPEGLFGLAVGKILRHHALHLQDRL